MSRRKAGDRQRPLPWRPVGSLSPFDRCGARDRTPAGPPGGDSFPLDDLAPRFLPSGPGVFQPALKAHPRAPACHKLLLGRPKDLLSVGKPLLGLTDSRVLIKDDLGGLPPAPAQERRARRR